ncbi:MAG: hypothetical protein ABH844_06630 [Candidatus Omnitrophota bacterium]
MKTTNLRDKVEQMIMLMVSAVHTEGLYGKSHSLTQKIVSRLHSELDSILQDQKEITIGIVGEEFAFEKKPFYKTSKKFKNFISLLKDAGAAKISFSEGIEKEELAKFCELLNESDIFAGETQKLKDRIEAEGIKNITVGKIGFKKQEEITGGDIDGLTKNEYQNGLDTFSRAVKELKTNRTVDIKSIRQIVGGIIAEILRNKNLMLILTATKKNEEGVLLNSMNVAVFTLLQAEALGLEEMYLSDIGSAALLNKMGQAAMEKEALEEKSGINTEAARGAKILLDSSLSGILSAVIVFERNLWYDGTGCPRRLFTKDLNFVSMMVAISDYYDILRGKRELAPEKVYEEMIQLSGKHFHPDLLNNFFSIMGIYPPGTLVELNTKEVGLVIKESVLDMKRPQVEVLYDDKGLRVKEPFTANLLEMDNRGKHKWTIIRSVSPVDKYQIPEKYTEM